MYAARTTDLLSHAYHSFPTELQLYLAVEHFGSGLRDAATRDYLRCERVRRRINWQEAIQRAIACMLPHASDRSSSYAAIASDTSGAKFANSPQSRTKSSNNCANTTPVATGNFDNPDVVTSSKVRALHRVTGASPISATLPRRKYLGENSALGQARHTQPYQISARRTRRTPGATPTCTLVRRVLHSRCLCSTVTGSPNNISTRRTRCSSSRSVCKRQMKRLR